MVRRVNITKFPGVYSVYGLGCAAGQGMVFVLFDLMEYIILRNPVLNRV